MSRFLCFKILPTQEAKNYVRAPRLGRTTTPYVVDNAEPAQKKSKGDQTVRVDPAPLTGSLFLHT